MSLRLAFRLAALAALCASPAFAERVGFVFVDGNGNGLREPSERPVPSVVVSNGRDVVRTDSAGRYVFASDWGRFLFITRPAGFGCERWYRSDAGDFALVPAPSPEDFTFIHFSDAHVYDRPSDPKAFATSHRYDWVPQFVRDWIGLRLARRVVEPRFSDDFVGGLRRALAPYRETAGFSDVSVLAAYGEEFQRPGSALGDVVPQIREAFRELAALAPDFFVSTGDQLLESNLAPPAPVQRWLRFFRELSQTLGAPVYLTIGNNEIAGSENEAFTPDHPQYGKRSFEAFFGPTYYSFDRAGFHFVATDTHRNEAAPGEDEDWSITRLPEAEREWLEADLALHRDRTVVVLNHEPFFFDPSWPFPFEYGIRADDEGILARWGVAYALSGHVHLNGVARTGATTFISTGALSGQRWLLPAELFDRGYRLVTAREGRLYTAWKRLGEPLVSFIDPAASVSVAAARDAWGEAASTERPARVVAVAVDRRGPFEALRIELDGEPLPTERWGAYFVSARLEPADDDQRLVVVATRKNGETLRAELRLSSSAGGS